MSRVPRLPSGTAGPGWRRKAVSLTFRVGRGVESKFRRSSRVESQTVSRSRRSLAQEMSQRSSLIAGTVTRTWLVAGAGVRYVIQLRHNTLSGFRYCMVNGQEVAGSDGVSTVMMTTRDVIKIHIVGAEEVVMSLRPDGAGFAYTCEVGGRPLQELNEMPESEVDSDPLEASIPVSSVQVDERGKNVAYYRVDALRKTDGKVRRGRDAAARARPLTAVRAGLQLLAPVL